METRAALQDGGSPGRAELIAKEYEEFAYIVSHDLNAPLRHVREFTQLLAGARGQSLTEEEKGYIEFLEKSLRRLDTMQEALLSFSRINTQAGPPETVDCNRLVTQVLEDLEDIIQKHEAVIECGKLPVLSAEPRQMRLLFFHLLENAVKFHADGAAPKITIAGRAAQKECFFEISDNGIGVSPEFHEQVFRLFRRLNPDKYPGIGAGLTIARKIVQRHGGDLHIKSALGNGTKVIFSIPKDGVPG